MPVFDEAEALENTGADRELLSEIICFALEDLPVLFRSLKGALKNGNTQEAASLAHKGKGTAGSIGAQALYMALFSLENLILAGDSDWEASFRNVIESFKAYRRDPEVAGLASLDHPG